MLLVSNIVINVSIDRVNTVCYEIRRDDSKQIKDKYHHRNVVENIVWFSNITLTVYIYRAAVICFLLHIHPWRGQNKYSLHLWQRGLASSPWNSQSEEIFGLSWYIRPATPQWWRIPVRWQLLDTLKSRMQHLLLRHCQRFHYSLRRYCKGCSELIHNVYVAERETIIVYELKTIFSL